MQIIEYEIKRYETWREELQQKIKNNNEAEKSQRKLMAVVKKQDQLLRGFF